MQYSLTIQIGAYTTKGRKAINQDFHNICVPPETQRSLKGVAIALADGISSSEVSGEASKIAVRSFLEDYYSTSEAWSVKKSAQRVIQATNAWLYAQNRQNLYHLDKDRGYVTTFSALILKAHTAYLFHIGDLRIYRLRDGKLEQLTQDHRVWISKEQSYLGRALGIEESVRIDYETFDLCVNDLFLLMSDGVYEYLEPSWLINQLTTPSDQLAQHIVQHAYDNGSGDNMTLQLIGIETLPTPDDHTLPSLDIYQKIPPLLEAREVFEGYTIIRPLHHTHRSHLYLATDNETQKSVVIKAPSIEMKEDHTHLEQLLLEEWVARRLNHPNLLRASDQSRKRQSLFSVMEYIQGITLRQWMRDHPEPSLGSVRSIASQLAKGLLAMHRQEMLHQDLRPENILIEPSGNIKIIDFGATRVTGITEINHIQSDNRLLGTLNYSAPEYFLGDIGSTKSDLFSLAVIVYEMLCGQLPYDTQIAKATTSKAQKKLHYHSLMIHQKHLPLWIDKTLQKALQIDPNRRYTELSEFIYDLHHPNTTLINQTKKHVYEKNPLLFWKLFSFVLVIIILFLLYD